LCYISTNKKHQNVGHIGRKVWVSINDFCDTCDVVAWQNAGRYCTSLRHAYCFGRNMEETCVDAEVIYVSPIRGIVLRSLSCKCCIRTNTHLNLCRGTR